MPATVTHLQFKFDLSDARSTAKLKIESLIAQCYRELRCLEEYSDERHLIATSDLRDRFESAIDAAQDLEHAFLMAQNADEDGE